VRREEEARDLRVREAGTAVLELLRGGDFASGNTSGVYRDVTELVCRALGVDCASLWMFDADRLALVSVEAFDRNTGEHSVEKRRFTVAANVEYFQALEHNRYVEARVNTPARTCATARSPGGKGCSRLDAAIRLRGDIVGALCIDHEGPRQWRSDEQVFVGSIADLVSLVIETNERLRTELALRESEGRYRELWQNALDGMFTIAPDGRFTSANDAGSRMTQVAPPALEGRRFTDFVAERERETAAALFDALVRDPAFTSAPFSFTLVRQDGSMMPVEATAQRIERDGRFVEILAIVRDVSQRRTLEAQLQQSQKMEAIGRLAGGVAHDFNNLLTAIIGYSQIATIRADVPPAAVSDLREITAAAQRAAGLTRQLLAFSRRQVLEPRVLDVNAVVSGIEVLLRRLIGEDIYLATDLDVEVAHVLADPSQLEQVILNLAVNARDAMPDGGRITLRTRSAAALDRRALVSGDAPAGPFVVLEVADTGIGMDEDTRSRIFEPFFTTKPLGTGLGLATVYGIVQQSGGGIAVDSSPGAGATFSIFLPVAAGQSDVPSARSPAIGPSGNEAVLVVEDDDHVRALASRVLRLAGYTVVEAPDPETALIAARTGAPLDLVLTDVVLPVMRGRELVDHLRSLQPQIKALYMSGYRDDHDGDEDSGAAFLPKPFTTELLTTAVRRALDAQRVSNPAN
jgi:PAS domain S-box-containing protein